ncbi:MAG: hypothetical protein JWQ35_875 [Bacteriovoracaceae bacterium]|nr:hypothetical protein [Bacteriovoracaceae bacterium]
MEITSSRNEIHFRRRFFHMLSGTLIVLIASCIGSKKVIVMLLCGLSGIAVLIELVRLSWTRANDWTMKLFGSLMRVGEKSQVSGLAHYCLGCTIAAIVFPRSIAFLSILYLAYGDPIASIAGVKFGKHLIWKHNQDVRKSVEGSLACFLFCAVMTFGLSFLFDMTSALPLDDRIIFSILGGLGAMIGEILPLKTDDNLALPLMSGAFLWLTSSIFNLIPGLYF